MKQNKTAFFLSAIISLFAISAFVYSLGPFSKFCSISGSASPTNVVCAPGNASANEDWTDATLSGSCNDGSSAGNPEAVRDIKINASRMANPAAIMAGEVVTINCSLSCYSSGNEYGILYKTPSTGWTMKQNGNCPAPGGNGLSSVATSFVTAEEAGTHYARCWISWSGCDSSTTCCGTTFADNDDLSFPVV